MKKVFLFFCAFIISSITLLHSQEKVKFGKITKEELEMTRYDQDSTASAVVLYEETDIRYEFDPSNFFKVVTRYFVRIKILTNDGLEEATRSVLRFEGKTRSSSDVLSGLTGYTYNLENGEIDKVKLSKEHIFEEKTTEYLTRTKFAFQSVKPGSVIEYKYELSSLRDGYLSDYYFQRAIPVKYCKYSLSIPEYYGFSKETKGVEIHKITSKISKENQTISVGGGMLTFTADTYNFVGEDLSGVKDESYIWSVNDYLTRVTFELRSFVIPGVVHRSYSATWANVDEEMLKYDNFGKQFNHKLFKTELATLFTPEMKDKDKVRAIYNMVRSKVSWNDQNTVTANDPKEALKKGLGSSGEINALLISALHEANFEAYPVVMSRRNIGRIPLSHPTIDNLNYFIVAANIDGNPIYMDASDKYGDLNVMAPSCLSDMSRSIRGNTLSGWVNLSNISKSADITSVNVLFNEKGELSGTVQNAMTNQIGYAFRKSYASHKNEQEYFDKLAADDNVEITKHSVLNVKETEKRVLQSYEFVKKDIVTGDDHIYFNPLIFPLLKENIFKAEERTLPVEFSYTRDEQIIVTIKLPEGYEVEEIPQSTKVSLSENNDASFQYVIESNKETRTISVTGRFTLNRIIYTPNEYGMLRDFFMHVATINNGQVVLKKI